jgi:hypothetical protein
LFRHLGAYLKGDVDTRGSKREAVERIRTLCASSRRAASRAPINEKSVTVEKRDAATHAGDGDGIAVERLLRHGGRPERERQSRA